MDAPRPTKVDFTATVLAWIDGRTSFERKALESRFTEIVLGVIADQCMVGDDARNVFGSFLGRGTGIEPALRVRDFVTFFLDVQCDAALHERAMERSAALDATSGFSPEQVAAIKASYASLPERFAGWQVAREAWRKDVLSVFTNTMLMEWHAMNVLALRSGRAAS